MNKRVLALLTVIALPVFAADAPKPATPAAPTEEQLLQQFRNDLQAKSADIMAKGLTLSADQAAKFWPMFEQFQKEQNAILDAQMKATQDYAKNFNTLSDADALAYLNALLERDDKIHGLRVAYLKKFQTVVPAKIAARAIHIDRRLGQVMQVKLSSQIPLIQ